MRDVLWNTGSSASCAPPGSEAGSYLRLIYFVSLNSRLESNKEEEDGEFRELRPPCNHRNAPLSANALPSEKLFHCTAVERTRHM